MPLMLPLTDTQKETLGDLWENNTSQEFDAVLALSEALGFDAARAILAKFVPLRYSVGSNMPGYMPDEAPDHLDTWEDARAAVVEAIKRDAEAEAESRPDETEPDGSHPIDAVRDAVLAEIDEAAPGENFNARFNRRVYWLTKTVD